MTEHNGWKNRETWNVALHLGNDEPTYRAVVEYASGRGEGATYLEFVRVAGLAGKKTRDGVAWVSELLDFVALDEAVREYDYAD